MDHLTNRILSSCIVAVSLGAGSSVQSATAKPESNSLVGTWRLVSYVDTPEDDVPIHAFGMEPIGLFIFTPDGHVSISIMRNPPDITAPTTDPDPDACIPAWYCAYFGTYTVNYHEGAWVTHVLGGNIPSYVGTDQKRSFTIRGDRLLISETYRAGDQTVHAERVLIREANTR